MNQKRYINFFVALAFSISAVSLAESEKTSAIPLSEQFIDCYAGLINETGTNPDVDGEGIDQDTKIVIRSPRFESHQKGLWEAEIAIKNHKYFKFFVSAQHMPFHGDKLISFFAEIREANTNEILASVSNLTIGRDSYLDLTATLQPELRAKLNQEYDSAPLKWINMTCRLSK